MKTVAVLVGSLRADSFNRRFAEALGRLAEGRLDFRFVEVGALPLYNEDLWAAPPEAVTAMKQGVEAADAVLLVTPEYNRTYSPALMNAIHWGTRPWGNNTWLGKPAAVVGVTPGATGTAAGQGDLRGLAVAVGMIVMTHPEVYFTHKPELYGSDGFADESAAKFLSGWVDAFAAWIERVG
jgi:chromate reductase